MARWHRSYDPDGRVWISPDDSPVYYSPPPERGCLASLKGVGMIAFFIVLTGLFLCLFLGGLWAAFSYAAHSAMDAVKAPASAPAKAVVKPAAPQPSTTPSPATPTTTTSTPAKPPLFDGREWRPVQK